ncbi:ORFL188C [Human betaherpesvirus 5]|nr:ORFL188C [Human betaherpesvirus 5]QHX40533.1 ORFL188C [Human betaherpesvirus 5]
MPRDPESGGKNTNTQSGIRRLNRTSMKRRRRYFCSSGGKRPPNRRLRATNEGKTRNRRR